MPGRKSKKTNKAGIKKPATIKGEDGKKSRIVFQLNSVTKNWSGEDGFELTVPELIIRQGEQVALVGFSGCGKSTLLDLLAMILQPDSAAEFVFFTAKNKPLDVADTWKRKKLDGLAHARMRHIGYVLQTGGLLPFLSVYDNIALSRYGLGLQEQDAVKSVAEQLAQMNDHIAVKYLAHLNKNDIVNQVKTCILDEIAEGNATELEAANALHTTKRNLHRKLQAQGTSFKQLLTETRQELAEQYINDSTLTLTEISFLLGFSEASSFTRSYKRWTGLPPSEARRRANQQS